MIEIYVKMKIMEYIRKTIYLLEITEKAKKGIEKFNILQHNIWEKVENWIIAEKEVDRNFIPNFIENIGEDIIHSTIKLLREELDLVKLSQEIFNDEKKTNPNIF